ncbi:hypothetical protein QR680_019350 [Steinernema hermaphroditum]|uniref:Uncharacterized protein n=1 Tax=Steinernema hermaphroditum TaxID=289476 RepID=A0AA39GQW9_9BILA|nr:hypothetical protein QR680_019350 [Steinernema hermaphroditum]
MLTLCFVTLLTLVSLDLTTSHPAHHIRLHHRHHVQHLVPQPVDMDPLRMSQNEIDKMYQQLSDYHYHELGFEQEPTLSWSLSLCFAFSLTTTADVAQDDAEAKDNLVAT